MRIEKLKQTIFINKENKNLIIFSFPESEYTPGSRFSIKISVEDRVVFEEECFDRINEVFLPLVLKDTNACLTVYQEGEKTVKYYFVLKPVKKWTFSFITSSHEDLGYCAWVNKLGAECADYTDAALDIMDRDDRYKYMIEHYWWLNGFNKYRTSEQKSRLKKYFKSGNIELNAPLVSNHTHWQSEEVLLRSLYPSLRNSAKDYDASVKTALYADLSGITWGAVNAYSHVGLKYVVIAENRYLRFTTDDEELPQLFWWIAPNNKDKLLCLHQNGYRPKELGHKICDTMRQYREGMFIFDKTKINSVSLTIDDMIKNLGDVEYDLYPCVFYDDHEFPTTMLLKVCDGLNSMWKYPKFNMSTPTECLSYIEQNFAETLPVKKGDWSEQWADFATISPLWMSKKRNAQRLLPIAETISAITSIKDGKEYPRSRINDSIWRMCEFDDHCWATSSKHPQEMHKFNLALIKRESANIAYKNLTDIINERISNVEYGNWLRIWNLLPQKRTTSLLLDEEYLFKNIRSQRLPSGQIITEPIELTPCGYRCYESSSDKRIGISQEVDVNTFETPYYKVICDLETHTVLSIFDKETQKELIDSNSSYAFAEFLYVNSETKHGKEWSIEHAQQRSFKIYQGELATIICITAYEEQIGANISVNIIFYFNEKNIDIECGFENATGLMGDFYDRYKKNIFWAFPIFVPNHHFCSEIVGGIVDERTDRLPNNPHDFVCVNNWVAAQNESGGIAFYTKDMPIVHLGDIHYNEISTNVDFSCSSNIFLYAASNRCNNLNFANKEDCKGIFRVSILPYEGNCADYIPAWCDNKNSVPIIEISKENEEYSFISVDNDNIRLTSCKLSEDDNRKLILRFIETSGRKTGVNLKVPSKVQSAFYSDGKEIANEGELIIVNNIINFNIEAFSYVTLVLNMEKEIAISIESTEDEFIKNIFAFEFENSKTLICFEKYCLDSIEKVEIYADGTLIDTVDSNEYYIQFSILPIIQVKQFKLVVYNRFGDKRTYIYKNN